MGFFKKIKDFFTSKKKENKDYLADELTEEFDRRNSRKEYKLIEQLQYVRTQCEQVADSSKYIAQLKAEHLIVSNYINDVKIIESQNEAVRKNLRTNAQAIVKLRNQRETLKNTASLLAADRYNLFEKYKNEFPQALTDFINDEKMLQKVKQDMRILEAEKVSLKEDMKDYERRRVNIRTLAIISLIAICAVFGIFIASGQFTGDEGTTLFMVVLLMAAVFVLLIVFLIRNTTYRMRVAEKKHAKTITILNKTKIKYVNMVNSMDYQKEKYGVTNSLELSKEYEAYLADKKKAEKYRSSAVELDEAIERFNARLAKMNLYDVSIWEKQITALVFDKDLDLVKKSLNNRCNKLVDQMEYNVKQIELAKEGIIKFVKKHPELSEQVMGIVESYEVDF